MTDDFHEQEKDGNQQPRVSPNIGTFHKFSLYWKTVSFSSVERFVNSIHKLNSILLLIVLCLVSSDSEYTSEDEELDRSLASVSYENSENTGKQE